MKKLLSIVLIAIGVLITEKTIIRLHEIWWIREDPFIPEPMPGRPYYVDETVRDGLRRPLVPAPGFAPSIFGRRGLWIGWDMIIVDIWQILARSLAAYVLIRAGALYFEDAVLKKKELIQVAETTRGK